MKSCSYSFCYPITWQKNACNLWRIGWEGNCRDYLVSAMLHNLHGYLEECIDCKEHSEIMKLLFW